MSAHHRCLTSTLTGLLTALLWLGPRPPGWAAPAQEKIRVLLLTGRNNHDWKATTPILEKILRQPGRFAVETTTDPGSLKPADLAKFDVLVSNWTTFPENTAQPWKEEMKRAFLDFVKGGKGFVVVHAGGTMFYDWPEYHRLIGATWGPNTGHGRLHEFAVKIADPNHPITRGLAGFRIADELWHRMQVNGPIQVLATAFSAQDTGGSGQDEPVAMIIPWEKGRCFNLVLGHDAAAMANPGFAALLARGTEWAATGQVRPSQAAAGTDADLDQVLQAISGYTFGQNRQNLFELEKVVYAAATDPARKQALAARLAATLDSEATPDAKKFLCQQLSLVGGPAEVNALARLLTNRDLAFAARSALERIPGEESLAALRAALGQATGPDRIGLINSLAVRGDAKAVPAIAALVSGSDAVTAAALDALGQLGGPEAVRALQTVQGSVPAGLQESLAHALLRCADRLLAAGQAESAATIFRQLDASPQPQPIRLAAFAGYLVSLGDKGSDLLLETLAGPDPARQAAAVSALRKSRSQSLLQKAADQLGTLPETIQVQLLTLLVERHQTRALPAVARAAAAGTGPVRKAALAALGTLGDATTVGTLVGLAEKADQEERKIIRASLTSLTGARVEEALSVALRQSAAAGQIELIGAVVSRPSPGAVPAVLEVLASPNAEVRREALKALGELGDATVCSRVIAVLADATDEDRAAAEGALAAVCRRAGKVDAVVEALPSAGAKQKVSLLAVLGMVGLADGLIAIRAQLQSADPATQQAAIQALAAWNDPAPLADLLRVAESSTEARLKRLALRGVARLASQAKNEPADRRLAVLIKALDLADRAEEQKALLSAVGSIPSLEAMRTAQARLKDPATAEEAGLTVLQIADQIGAEQAGAARAAIAQVLESSQSTMIRGRALAVLFRLDAPRNLARGAAASSPDEIDADGQAGGDAAAIDGDPGTYWDEADNQKLYRLRVVLKSAGLISAIRILGYAHQNYAPKDFEVICDDQVVKTVREAQYLDNRLEVGLPPTRCQAVELKITGSYGPSPAIRELQILGEPAGP